MNMEGRRLLLHWAQPGIGSRSPSQGTGAGREGRNGAKPVGCSTSAPREMAKTSRSLEQGVSPKAALGRHEK